MGLFAMVVKTETCNYSGFRIYPGHGKKFVRSDQKMFTFITGKAMQCQLMKRRNLTTKWTVHYRRINKKGSIEEAEKGAVPRRPPLRLARSLACRKRCWQRRGLRVPHKRTSRRMLCLLI